MSLAPAPSGQYDARGEELLLGQKPVGVAVAFHLLVWSLGPALLFGNLHADTLEAVYWGRDLAFGYGKHPPMATWLMDLVMRTGVTPLFGLMALSQATMAVTTVFVWKSARLYASPQTAALAVLLFLTAPAATLYAVQLNHNSVLSPFWAATLYFGLVYLEERRWPHALALGLVAGLGFITKYEILVLLTTLVALAAITPRFRRAFLHPASYLCVLVFAAIAAPHLVWLDANEWPSLSRALGTDRMRNVSTLNVSGINAIVGMFTLFFAPMAILFASMNRRVADEFARGPDLRTIALTAAFFPALGLLLGSVATMQVMKPLWVLPLASSAAVGLALLFPAGSGAEGLGERFIAKTLIWLSAVLFVGFGAYLFIAGALGKSLAAYSADTRPLATAVARMWSAHHSTALRCIVISDRKIGPSGVLFLPGRPDYVDFSSPSWQTPRQIGECRRNGAIAVLAEASKALEHFPTACRGAAERLEVRTMPGMGKVTWPVELVYIPPEGSGARCDAVPNTR